MPRALTLLLMLSTACGDSPDEQAPKGSGEVKPLSVQDTPASPPTVQPEYFAPEAQAKALQAPDFAPDSDEWGAGADLISIFGSNISVDLKGSHDDLDCTGAAKEGRLTLSCETQEVDATWRVNEDGTVTSDLFAKAHGVDAPASTLVKVAGDFGHFAVMAVERASVALAQRYAGPYRGDGEAQLTIAESGSVTRNGEPLSARFEPCVATGLTKEAKTTSTTCLLVDGGRSSETHYAWADGWVPVAVNNDFPEWEVTVKAGEAPLRRQAE